MSCTTEICGTGDWNGPKPGDPDLSQSALSAVAVYGGVEVSWSYPTVLPEAVAFTKVYRSSSSSIVGATEIALVSGTKYFDQIQEVSTLYYWIRMVSVHGTEGALIGPASVTTSSWADDTMNGLEGKLSETVLARELKTKIDSIQLNALDIQAEIANRIAANQTLGNFLNSLQGDMDSAIALINSEIVSRIDGQDALVGQYDLLAVANQKNAAAIAHEREVSVTENEAMAREVNSVLTKTNNNTTLIQNETYARTTADSALGTRIDTLSSTVNNNAASVQTSINTLVDKDTALAQQITNVNAAIGTTVSSAIRDEKRTLADPNKTIAENINTVQSSLNGQIASVRTDATTAINSLTGTVNTIYTVKLQSGDLIGGFGLVNNSKEVAAIFDIDRFGVGRAGVGQAYPFEVSNGNAYIKNAFIHDAAITNAKIENLAVNSLKLGPAAVETLKIASNAVNLPVAATASGSISGSGGTWKDVATVLLPLDIQSQVFAITTGNVTYPLGGNTDGTTAFRILVNNSVVYTCTSPTGYPIPSASISLTGVLGAGHQTIAFQFQSTYGTLINGGIFVMGIKR